MTNPLGVFIQAFIDLPYEDKLFVFIFTFLFLGFCYFIWMLMLSMIKIKNNKI